MSGNNDLSNLSGSYALHGLEGQELADFEQYLERSEVSRNEVTELSDTAVFLGLAVQPVTPRPALKQSIMDQLDATPQLASEAPASSPVFADGAATRRAQARWFTRPMTALVAAAAAVAIIVGGGVIANTLGDTTFQQQQADALAAINAADDSQRTSADVAGGGTATLVWSGELASSVMMVDGVDPLPADKVYELWYIDEDGARPAGTFTVGEDGSTWRVLDGAMGPGDTVGLTIEPAGGSMLPTTDPVVAIHSA